VQCSGGRSAFKPGHDHKVEATTLDQASSAPPESQAARATPAD
jgi:hypothetical protein